MMQENCNKTLNAYRSGVLHERARSKDSARAVISAIKIADSNGLIQSVDDVVEIIRVEFDLIDER